VQLTLKCSCSVVLTSKAAYQSRPSKSFVGTNEVGRQRRPCSLQERLKFFVFWPEEFADTILTAVSGQFRKKRKERMARVIP